MRKISGEDTEPDFLVGEKRVYDLYFIEEREDYHFNGRNYKMTATHLETKEHNLLSEMDIQDSHSIANFEFTRAGIWEIEVAIDGDDFIRFNVEAKNPEE